MIILSSRKYFNIAELKSDQIACLKSKSVSELKTAFTNLPALKSGIGIDGVIGADNAKTLQFAAHLDGTIIQVQPSDEGVRVPTIFGSSTFLNVS